MTNPKILIIGATGFVGHHLLEKLEAQNIPIRLMARNLGKVKKCQPQTQIVQGDLDQKDSLVKALEGIEVVFYLAHAMADSSDEFYYREIQQAQNLCSFLTSHQRLIYLGGIIPEGQLSYHLKARKEVGEVLRNSLATTIELRASIIIGSGSASFEIVRAIVNRLPVIVTAKWTSSLCQPIALEDVLSYLQLCINHPFHEKNNIYEIGGKDVLPYEEILIRYAKLKRLYRPHIFIKDFPKHLALQVMSIICPEHFEVGKSLMESIEHTTIVKDYPAAKEFSIAPKNLEESFSLLKDNFFDDSSSVSKKIVDHFKDIPTHLFGDSFQIFIPLVNKTFEQFIDERLPLLREYKVSAEKMIARPSFRFKLLGIGEFFFKYNPDKNGVLVIIKPLYFFQSIGLTIMKKIIL